MTNSTIQNLGAGNGIVVQGTSSPLIQANAITNVFYHGIVLPGGSGTVVLDNNIITNSAGSYHGITMVGASANLTNNVSMGNNAGLYLENGAYLWSEVGVPHASNWFINNSYGIILYTNSFADLGYVDGSFVYGTCNRIETNSLYNVYMDGTSNLQAMGNSWNPIPPEKTLVGSGGTFNYACRVQSWLDCSQTVCGGASPRVVSSSGSQTEDRDLIFRDANLAIAQRDYLRAEELFAYLLTSANLTTERIEALKGLHRVFYRSKNAGIIIRVLPFASGNDEAGLVASEILMAMYAGAGQYEKAITLGNLLRAAYANTPVEERALVRLAGLAGYDAKYRPVSQEAIGELHSRFGDSVDAGLLAALGVGESGSLPQASEASAAAEELSLSSYPNPFNPST
ncbi:MAG: right-handed parallel beta-helix repeat-containing protein, partial [Bacteroidota bacterium]